MATDTARRELHFAGRRHTSAPPRLLRQVPRRGSPLTLRPDIPGPGPRNRWPRIPGRQCAERLHPRPDLRLSADAADNPEPRFCLSPRTQIRIVDAQQTTNSRTRYCESGTKHLTSRNRHPPFPERAEGGDAAP